MRDLPLVAGQPPGHLLGAEALQGRVRRQGRLHGDQGTESILLLLSALGSVGETAMSKILLLIAVGAVFCVSLSGCGKKADTPPPDDMTSEEIQEAFFTTNSHDSVER